MKMNSKRMNVSGMKYWLKSWDSTFHLCLDLELVAKSLQSFKFLIWVSDNILEIIPSIEITLTPWNCYNSDSQMIAAFAAKDSDKSNPCPCFYDLSGLLLELFPRRWNYFKSLKQAGEKH